MGTKVGTADGTVVGLFEGTSVGSTLGSGLGLVVGTLVGAFVSSVGMSVGGTETGATVGCTVGACVVDHSAHREFGFGCTASGGMLYSVQLNRTAFVSTSAPHATHRLSVSHLDLHQSKPCTVVESNPSWKCSGLCFSFACQNVASFPAPTHSPACALRKTPFAGREGICVGSAVLGRAVGETLGAPDGTSVGAALGACDGASDGDVLGERVGLTVGVSVSVGERVGSMVVGDPVGSAFGVYVNADVFSERPITSYLPLAIVLSSPALNSLTSRNASFLPSTFISTLRMMLPGITNTWTAE